MKKTEIDDQINGSCRKEKCPMYRNYGKECPMLVQNSWIDKDQKIKQTDDCAPITGMRMQQDVHNRVLAVQKAQEETREQFSNLRERFDTMIKQSTIFMLEQSKPKKRRTLP